MQAHPSTFIIYARGTSSPSTKLIKQPIDVAAIFEVSLTTVGDLHKLINDIEAGKHDELLSEMTNDDRMETLNAIGTICKSVHYDDNNTDVIPFCGHQYQVNIYVGATCASVKDQPIVNSNIYTLVVNSVFDGVNISIPRKVVEKVSTRFEHTLYGYFIGKRMVFPVVEYYARNNWVKHGWSLVNSEADLMDVITIGIPSLSGDGFTKETICVEYEWRLPRCDILSKKKKRKRKSKSTNGGQFVGLTHQTTSYSFKKDNHSMSNSFSALNDKEDDDEEGVQNVYDESANLFQNTKAGGSSSFTATTG
nr:zinc knuckle CX2CX4HX4C [Tanacetum cinerariifolium]